MDKRGKGLAILNDTTYEKMALQVHQLTEVRNFAHTRLKDPLRGSIIDSKEGGQVGQTSGEGTNIRTRDRNPDISIEGTNIRTWDTNPDIY